MNRDELGRVVREAWVCWARTQPNPKPSWLVPWDDLPESDREADRQIAEAVLAQAKELEALRNPKPPRTVPCLRCRGRHVCVGSEPGLCEFPCHGCNCTGEVKESPPC